MTDKIIIYQLHSKIVNQREDIPEEARQIVYYSLAVGHHIGVMDCFSRIAEVPLDKFCLWLEQLPAGAGRSKLEGVLKWGEIEINRSHVDSLLVLCESSTADQKTWVPVLFQSLRGIQQEPALYLMLRKNR
jgi:hypothetical protein